MTGETVGMSARAARLSVVLVAGLIALWVSVGVTVTLVAGEANPDAARSLWWGAAPRIAAGDRLVGQSVDAATLDRGVRDLTEALCRDPASVQAARTLALLDLQRGRMGVGNRLMDYAQTLSRRDMATELFLIERFVQSGDISGALRHYDHALRTSRQLADVLMPVLIQAMNDPSVRAQLAAMLRANPPWRYEFFTRVLVGANDPSALFALMEQARLRSGESGGATFTRQLVDRLIAAKAYVAAFAAYRTATGRQTLPLLRDGGFETRNAIPPIEWWFSDDPDLYAVPENVAGAGEQFALRIVAKDGKEGVVARQLLLLGPGRYRLTGRLGGLEGARTAMAVTIGCAGDARQIAKVTPAVPSEGAGMFGIDFQVTGACPAMWLSFGATGPDVGETDFWVDDVALDRIGN